MPDITITKSFLSDSEADYAYELVLRTINWQDNLKVVGTDTTKRIRRKMSYVTDVPTVYRYTNLELQGETWTPELLAIRYRLEACLIGRKFNSVLLNLYENGKDEIRWHSDKEEQLGDNPVIACVNLGATRNFWFRSKETGEKTAYAVEHGDLLVMWEHCQERYLHAILKETAVKEPRISLTYRWVK